MEPVRYPQSLEPRHTQDSGESPPPIPPSVAFTLSSTARRRNPRVFARGTPPRPRRLWSPPRRTPPRSPRHAATGTTSVASVAGHRGSSEYTPIGHHGPGAASASEPPRTPPARRELTSAREASRGDFGGAAATRGEDGFVKKERSQNVSSATCAPRRHHAQRRRRRRHHRVRSHPRHGSEEHPSNLVQPRERVSTQTASCTLRKLAMTGAEAARRAASPTSAACGGGRPDA